MKRVSRYIFEQIDDETCILLPVNTKKFDYMDHELWNVKDGVPHCNAAQHVVIQKVSVPAALKTDSF